MSALVAIEGWSPIAAIRTSNVLYPLVNALHILGLGILLGSILTLDLRVLGLWKGAGWREAVSELSPVAAFGFGLAIITGALLFAVRASHYIENPALLAKWGLIGLALVNLLFFHRALRRSSAETPTTTLRLCAALSAASWIGAVFAGRWIAFVE